MAVPYAKIPGASERTLENVVPGLSRHGRGGVGGFHAPPTGAALRSELRRRKLGVAVGRTSLVCSLVFAVGVLAGLVLPESWTEGDAVIFGWIWGVTAIVVHLGVFVADELRGRDAPLAGIGLGIFWLGMIVLGLT